nr:DEAD/DEAH box helicase [Knoellia sp. DB2414S]
MRSGAPKKARWTASQKAAAKKGPKKAHRGQSVSAAKNGPATTPGAKGAKGYAGKAPREERSPRWRDRDDARTERPRGERGARRDERPTRGYERRDDRGYERRDSRYDRRDDRGYERRDSRYDRRDDRGYDRRDDRRSGGGGGFERRDRRDDRRQDRRYERRDDRFERRDTRDDARQEHWERSERARRTERAGHTQRPVRRFDREERRFERGERPARRFDRDDRAPRFEEQVDPEAQRLEADTWVKATRKSVEGPVTVSEDNGFAALGLPERIVERLARDGITEPFPIQAATIPDALAGRDVLGRGQTGSGKTLAFGLPMLARLADGTKAQPRHPRALVLVPTRELAMQVSDALEPLVHVLGLRHKLVAGGLSYTTQIAALNRGVEVLIATPGRLKDLLEREAVDLSSVEIAVLDEADHMADMGFMPEVTAILDRMPAGGQRLLFSATLDKGIDELVARYLSDPVTHSTDEAKASVTTMDHHILLIEPVHKKVITAEIANRSGRTVVFVRTKLGADRVAQQLRDSGVYAAALHGGLGQGARNRVLGAFRDGSLPVLVATDVAARGIHVDDVSVVLQVDPPADHKDYLHRSGRTARAGDKGTVVTLALPHQRKTMERMAREAGVDAMPTKAVPGDAVLAAAGATPPSGIPVPEEKFRRLLEGDKRPRRGGPRAGGPGRRGRDGRDGARQGGPRGRAPRSARA